MKRPTSATQFAELPTYDAVAILFSFDVEFPGPLQRPDRAIVPASVDQVFS